VGILSGLASLPATIVAVFVSCLLPWFTYLYTSGAMSDDAQRDSQDSKSSGYCNVYLEVGRHHVKFFPDDFGPTTGCHYGIEEKWKGIFPGTEMRKRLGFSDAFPNLLNPRKIDEQTFSYCDRNGVTYYCHFNDPVTAARPFVHDKGGSIPCTKRVEGE
jgi:hypothetical protein